MKDLELEEKARGAGAPPADCDMGALQRSPPSSGLLVVLGRLLLQLRLAFFPGAPMSASSRGSLAGDVGAYSIDVSPSLGKVPDFSSLPPSTASADMGSSEVAAGCGMLTIALEVAGSPHNGSFVSLFVGLPRSGVATRTRPSALSGASSSKIYSIASSISTSSIGTSGCSPSACGSTFSAIHLPALC